MSDAAVGEVRDRAKKVEDHPAAAGVAAAGHVVNGVVHAIIGAIALGIARGAGGSADQAGAMRAIQSHPLGSVALWVVGIALIGLAVYSIAVAIGESSSDKRDAVKSLGRAIAYAAVGSVAVTFALGGSADGEETTKSLSAQLMQTWWGTTLLFLTGVAVFAAGAAMVFRGVTRSFLDDTPMPPKFRTTFTWLGVVGYIAKGVAVGIVGVLFVVAVLTSDASNSGGLDGALKSLVELPYGPALLAVVAVGLILYGVFCLARARVAALKAAWSS